MKSLTEVAYMKLLLRAVLTSFSSVLLTVYGFGVLPLIAGANVKQADLHGRHALHYACRNGHEHIAAYLLSKDSPPDHPDQDGLTPITMAVISGKTNCVHQLLEFNANIDSLN